MNINDKETLPELVARSGRFVWSSVLTFVCAALFMDFSAYWSAAAFFILCAIFIFGLVITIMQIVRGDYRDEF